MTVGFRRCEMTAGNPGIATVMTSVGHALLNLVTLHFTSAIASVDTLPGEFMTSHVTPLRYPAHNLPCCRSVVLGMVGQGGDFPTPLKIMGREYLFALDPSKGRQLSLPRKIYKFAYKSKIS